MTVDHIRSVSVVGCMAIAGCDIGPMPVCGGTNLSLIAVCLASGPQ